MNLYRITIKPVTSFCSPLQSDTLFGAFCWSYVSIYGETVLNELLVRYKNGNPDIIFSNAFPSGTLPLPFSYKTAIQLQDNAESKTEKYQQYINSKKIENINYIEISAFNKIINGIPVLDFTDINMEISRISWRNMINRSSGTVQNTNGSGSLYEVKETFSSGMYDVYIYTELPKEVLDKTLRLMFLLGIGAQRSTGKGAFDMIGNIEIVTDLIVPKDPNAVVALSNFIPSLNDSVSGYYKTFVKYPKMSHVSSEKGSPFKKPMIFMKAGSVLLEHSPKLYYGSCIQEVALVDGRVSDSVIVGAYTIAIPCRI